MPKKNLIIIASVVVALLVIGGGVFAWQKMSGGSKKTVTEEPKKKKIAEPVNVLAVADRPYIRIVPTDAYHVSIIVESVKKSATEMDYELEYQAGSLLQGAFDKLPLASLPAQKDIYFGSCSAGGACTKHEEVKGGTLLTRFSGPENYALKSEWRFFDGKTKLSQIASKDAKFQMDGKSLETAGAVVVFNSPGYPAGLSGTPVSDPYSLTSSGSLKGKATVTLRANEEGNLALMGWDGTSWKSFQSKVEGKSLTAEVDLMQLYIVVKK